VEAEIAKALEKLEQEDASADELKKAQLGVKRAMYVPPRSFVVSADKSIGKRRWLPLDNHDIAFISFIVQAASDMIQGLLWHSKLNPSTLRKILGFTTELCMILGNRPVLQNSIRAPSLLPLVHLGTFTHQFVIDPPNFSLSPSCSSLTIPSTYEGLVDIPIALSMSSGALSRPLQPAPRLPISLVATF